MILNHSYIENFQFVLKLFLFHHLIHDLEANLQSFCTNMGLNVDFVAVFLLEVQITEDQECKSASKQLLIPSLNSLPLPLFSKNE